MLGGGVGGEPGGGGAGDGGGGDGNGGGEDGGGGEGDGGGGDGGGGDGACGGGKGNGDAGEGGGGEGVGGGGEGDGGGGEGSGGGGEGPGGGGDGRRGLAPGGDDKAAGPTGGNGGTEAAQVDASTLRSQRLANRRLPAVHGRLDQCHSIITGVVAVPLHLKAVASCTREALECLVLTVVPLPAGLAQGAHARAVLRGGLKAATTADLRCETLSTTTRLLNPACMAPGCERLHQSPATAVDVPLTTRVVEIIDARDQVSRLIGDWVEDEAGALLLEELLRRTIGPLYLRWKQFPARQRPAHEAVRRERVAPALFLVVGTFGGRAAAHRPVVGQLRVHDHVSPSSINPHEEIFMIDEYGHTNS
eukprot:4773476-Prymnesium_polylepis.1